jgi:hypothetical protein
VTRLFQYVRFAPGNRTWIEHASYCRAAWADALEIKNAHGYESEIAKHVEKVWAQCDSGRKQAFQTATSFQARGFADLAAKLTFARADRLLRVSPRPWRY